MHSPSISKMTSSHLASLPVSTDYSRYGRRTGQVTPNKSEKAAYGTIFVTINSHLLGSNFFNLLKLRAPSNHYQP